MPPQEVPLAHLQVQGRRPGSLEGLGKAMLELETISFKAHGPFPPRRGLLGEPRASLRRAPLLSWLAGGRASEGVGNPEKVIGL